eukprot:TRINITY_DN2458_c0_g1_i1.p1 TRINITY_DN2458_c0_g1~~TRINITY_DN2458_c0_g1_i1.p1  ORF type:complete len:550 (-),score=135.21 TRINITY_DN2458_c0_g1_i1:28-1677(-)
MSYMLQPSIILLKEGTDTSQGIGQLISNINACEAVVDIIRTTLGPCGMDKLVYSERSNTISNDGATIMKLLDIVHPAAKSLVEIAKSQDEEVGDGTTSVVILAGELLTRAKSFIEEGIHPQTIIRTYRKACELAKQRVRELTHSVETGNAQELRELLERCAATSLNSKLIGSHANFFAKIVTDTVLQLDEDLDLNMIGIKKVPGGSLEDTLFVEGVAFKKTFSYAGFEQQPKKFVNPKIILLNIELELKSEKENAEIRVGDADDFKRFVDAEWNIIYRKLDEIIDTGANVVLSRLAIGDLATQYFADRNIFCAGRVAGEDIARVARAVGGRIQTTTNRISESILGTCDLFEERQVGGERFNFFTGCENSKTATIILRGGGDHFIDEAERSLHDSIMIVRRARKHQTYVSGGGAIEMEVSRTLHKYSITVDGAEQSIIKAYGSAFETIPRQLADNAGLDPIKIVAQLRKKHHEDDDTSSFYGVDILNDGIFDTFAAFVWEPALVKLNSIEAATEAACLILSVDETVRNPKADHKIPQSAMPGGQMPGRPF